MRKIGIVAALMMTLALAACSGGSGTLPKTATSAAPTGTSVPAATATPAPAPVPVPDRPVAFGDYARVIAAYLSASPDAAAECLAPLYAAWQMPRIDLNDACLAANTDADPENEIVAVISGTLSPPMPIAEKQYEVVVFDRTGDSYAVVYESTPDNIPPPNSTEPVARLIDAGDLNGDGTGEFAYSTENCGAHTCVATVHIIQGAASGYVALPPVDGISIETPNKIAFVAAAVGKQLVLQGGVIGSVGAGPQRERTETWAWNGTAYAIVASKPAPPEYLYHAIIDANAAFEAGDFAGAEKMYIAAADDATLKEWMPNRNERSELQAWALFRAGVAVLMRGGDSTTAIGYFNRARGYANTLQAQLAGSFQAAYEAKGSVSVGCGAVRDDIQANLAEYQKFWDFGYANPTFDPATVCPF